MFRAPKIAIPKPVPTARPQTTAQKRSVAQYSAGPPAAAMGLIKPTPLTGVGFNTKTGASLVAQTGRPSLISGAK